MSSKCITAIKIKNKQTQKNMQFNCGPMRFTYFLPESKITIYNKDYLDIFNALRMRSGQKHTSLKMKLNARK